MESLQETLDNLQNMLNKKRDAENNDATYDVTCSTKTEKYLRIHKEGSREFGYCSPEKDRLKAEHDRQVEALEFDHSRRCADDQKITRYELRLIL